jgi:type VI protein secretion system component Hcp
MKTLLCSLFISLALCVSGFAQTISVTAVIAGVNCTFAASSVSEGFTNNGLSSSVSPLKLVKTLDKCSAGLLRSMPARVLTTVTISVTMGGAVTPIQTITLSNVLVASVADDEGSASLLGLPSQTVTLTYEKIQIQDLITKTSTTCDLSSGVCS